MCAHTVVMCAYIVVMAVHTVVVIAHTVAVCVVGGGPEGNALQNFPNIMPWEIFYPYILTE